MCKIIDLAIAGAKSSAASPLFRAMLPCALACFLLSGAPALADSKSSAEFVLATCLAAMDDFAKVEAIARENNWITKTPPGDAWNKFMTSQSMWEVMKGEDKFRVWIGISHRTNRPPHNVCAVTFLSKNANREEFFNSISASVELVSMSDTKGPELRLEDYELQSDRTNNLMLSINSQSDGTLTLTILQENFVGAAHPRLGVRVQQVTEEIAASKKLKSARGALVTAIDDTGAAKRAGIQVGDVIIKLDGKDIAEMRDLPRVVAATPADKTVDVAVIRDAEERMFSVTFGR